jgi:acetyl esterase
MRGKAPLRVRVLGNQGGGLDWDTVSTEELLAFRAASNRKRSSKLARLVTGFPDRQARITECTLRLSGRSLTTRVHRPEGADSSLPLVVQFHGGGFAVGTAVQNDWLNSRLAVRCPAVVVSVEYRLAPEHPLPAPVEDADEALTTVIRDAGEWGVDAARVAVMGESAGGTLAALAAIHARDAGLALRAQVLLYPCVDWTDSMFDYPSIADNAENPTLPLPVLRAYRRFCLPPALDARTVSPLAHSDLGGLAPALVQTAQLDPVEDHGRAYADRLRAEGTDVTLTRYPNATHGFLSAPGLVGAARRAGPEVIDFLRSHLRVPARRPEADRR